MTEPEPDAWTDRTSGRKRVRLVVETLDEPASVSEIADRADVAWATADSELERLEADRWVRKCAVDGRTKFEPDPVRLFIDQVLELVEENDRSELEARLVDYQSRIESLQDEHGATGADEFRERLTAEDVSAAEMREIRNVAATWEALETERRLVRQALNLYDDVSQFSGTGSDGVPA